MSINSERVKNWRRRTKARMIEAFGGSCCICGYHKCDEALEFHHLDPNEKEFGFGKIRGNIKGWDTIVKELRKCVMLCSNCHREVHSNVSDVQVPTDAQRFNEEYNDYRALERRETKDSCPVCGDDKPIRQKTCSRSCSVKITGKVDWSKIDVIALVEEYGSFEAAGEHLSLSGAAVSRRHKIVTNL